MAILPSSGSSGGPPELNIAVVNEHGSFRSIVLIVSRVKDISLGGHAAGEVVGIEASKISEALGFGDVGDPARAPADGGVVLPGEPEGVLRAKGSVTPRSWVLVPGVVGIVGVGLGRVSVFGCAVEGLCVPKAG